MYLKLLKCVLKYMGLIMFIFFLDQDYHDKQI